MNWLTIGIVMCFMISIIIGYQRGILRIGVSLLATIVSIILVIIITPYMSNAIAKWTPIHSMIEKKCVDIFVEDIPVKALEGIDLKGTSLENVDLSEIQNDDLSQLDLSMDDLAMILKGIAPDVQASMIQESDFPNVLKLALLKNNNLNVYEALGVTTFPQYIASYISGILIHILSFLIAFVLVKILAWACIAAVDIISELPVMGRITKITGGIAGAAVALIEVWIFFVVITVLCTTVIGQVCLEQIEQSPFLRFLYENNFILNFLMSF